MLGKVTYKGQLTIPQQIRQQVGLEDGDYVEIELIEGRIVLTPKAMVDKDQLWFWTREWQQKEHLVDEDIKAGRVTEFGKADEAIKWLKRRD